MEASTAERRGTESAEKARSLLSQTGFWQLGAAECFTDSGPHGAFIESHLFRLFAWPLGTVELDHPLTEFI